MVVLECAGSIPTAFMASGNSEPIKTLVETITNKLDVIANVSCNGVKKAKALMNPAMERMILNQRPSINSFLKNCFVLDLSIVPSAKPRMTRTLA